MDNLCFELDDELKEKPIWIAELSNKQSVYQKDTETVNSWVELRKYCLKNNLYIERMRLKFFDNVIHIPKADNYFCIKSLIKFLIGNNKPMFYLVIGYQIDEQTFLCNKYHLASWCIWETFTRSKNQCEELIISGKK